MSPMIIATSTLGFSIVGLIALISLKGWELKTGKFILGPQSKLRRGAEEIIERTHMDVPRAFGKGFRFSGRLLRAYISFLLAKLLIVFERILERVLHSLKSGPSNISSRGEASAFLREIAAYKRMLGKPDTNEEKRLE